MRLAMRTLGSSGSASAGGASGSTSDTKTRLSEPGDHANDSTAFAESVSLRASPPPVPMVQSCVVPFSSGLRNATRLPSGEKDGALSLGPLVNCDGTPSGSAVRMMRDRLDLPGPCMSERTNTSSEPSGDTDGCETDTISYTSSLGVIGDGMAILLCCRNSRGRLPATQIPCRRPSISPNACNHKWIAPTRSRAGTHPFGSTSSRSSRKSSGEGGSTPMTSGAAESSNPVLSCTCSILTPGISFSTRSRPVDLSIASTARSVNTKMSG